MQTWENGLGGAASTRPSAQISVVTPVFAGMWNSDGNRLKPDEAACGLWKQPAELTVSPTP